MGSDSEMRLVAKRTVKRPILTGVREQGGNHKKIRSEI